MGAMIARGPTLNKHVTDLLGEAAEAEGIPHALRGLLAHDARPTPTRFHLARAGIPTGLFSIPTRYMHTPNELCDLDDVEVDRSALIVAFARRARPRPVLRPLMASRSVIVSARADAVRQARRRARRATRRPSSARIVIRAALERIGVEPHEPQYVIMGQVLQGGAGQAPARQAAIAAGLPKETPADTINKVCASSIRAIEIADSMIRAGDVDVVVTGGMESMIERAVPP